LKKGFSRISGHLVSVDQSTRLAQVTGALLHFKFFAHFHNKAKLEAARGEHFQGALEYKRYLAYLRKRPNISFMYRGSRRYRSSDSLLQLGLIQTLPAFDALATQTR
jgi:hypothetical protein